MLFWGNAIITIQQCQRIFVPINPITISDWRCLWNNVPPLSMIFTAAGHTKLMRTIRYVCLAFPPSRKGKSFNQPLLPPTVCHGLPTAAAKFCPDGRKNMTHSLTNEWQTTRQSGKWMVNTCVSVCVFLCRRARLENRETKETWKWKMKSRLQRKITNPSRSWGTKLFPRHYPSAVVVTCGRGNSKAT